MPYNRINTSRISLGKRDKTPIEILDIRKMKEGISMSRKMRDAQITIEMAIDHRVFEAECQNKEVEKAEDLMSIEESQSYKKEKSEASS